jgi:hypothetical protein
MIDKFLKLASYYDKTLQFDKSDEVHKIINKIAQESYFNFIKENVDDPADYCFFYSALVNIEYPELKLIEGEPVDPEKGETAHFWLEDEDGNIIDPTQAQYDGDICYKKIKEVDINKNLDWVVNSPKFDSLKKSLKQKVIKLIKDNADKYDEDMKYKKADKYVELLKQATP